MTEDRVFTAYLAFRSGFSVENSTRRPPKWEKLSTWMRDAMQVCYLQGKLDGTGAGAGPSAQNTRNMLDSLAEWCSIERDKLGAVDGYDYRSGEEYGLRRAEIEISKRLAALSAIPAAPSAQGLAPSVWNDEYQAKALKLAAEVRDRRRAESSRSYQEKLLLADALMHAVVSAAGMPSTSHESVRREVIEECARICERIQINAERRGAGHLPQSPAQHAAYDKAEGASECKRAIRALASPATPEALNLTS